MKAKTKTEMMEEINYLENQITELSERATGRSPVEEFVGFLFGLSAWSRKAVLQGIIRQTHFRLWGAAPEFSPECPSEKSLLEFCRKAEYSRQMVQDKIGEERSEDAENTSPYQSELESASEREAQNETDYQEVKTIFQVAMKAWNYYWEGEDPLAFGKKSEGTPF